MLLGEDRGRARRALRQVLADASLDAWGPDVTRTDGGRGWAAEVQEALSHAVWTAGRRLAVVWDLALASDTDGLSDLEAWTQAGDGAAEDDPWLIVWAPTADRRLKVYKALVAAKALVDVAPPDARGAAAELGRLVSERGGAIDARAAGGVVTLVGTGLDGLEQEADKLTLLCGERTITEKDVALATTGRTDVSIFRLTEALSGRRLGDALTVAGRLLGGGESAIGLLAMLAREMRLLGRTKVLAGEGKDASSLGLPPFVVSRLERDARSWTAAEIRRAFRTLLDADLALKSGGPPAVTLDLCLIDLLTQPSAVQSA